LGSVFGSFWGLSGRPPAARSGWLLGGFLGLGALRAQKGLLARFRPFFGCFRAFLACFSGPGPVFRSRRLAAHGSGPGFSVGFSGLFCLFSALFRGPCFGAPWPVLGPHTLCLGAPGPGFPGRFWPCFPAFAWVSRFSGPSRPKTRTAAPCPVLRCSGPFGPKTGLFGALRATTGPDPPGSALFWGRVLPSFWACFPCFPACFLFSGFRPSWLLRFPSRFQNEMCLFMVSVGSPGLAGALFSAPAVLFPQVGPFWGPFRALPVSRPGSGSPRALVWSVLAGFSRFSCFPAFWASGLASWSLPGLPFGPLSGPSGPEGPRGPKRAIFGPFPPVWGPSGPKPATLSGPNKAFRPSGPKGPRAQIRQRAPSKSGPKGPKPHRAP